ncbi:Hypothetical predicted protein [Olea europaea subsp. europaea]|uniref:Uncharacterized protein n=1 Tax=Olea europaea subsp. europaea TaxID=158383 RepID=A0A8S0TNY7_OLEEU|nr:Hypothetical predicted protein [Olea europaea subsp. europaea]
MDRWGEMGGAESSFDLDPRRGSWSQSSPLNGKILALRNAHRTACRQVPGFLFAFGEGLLLIRHCADSSVARGPTNEHSLWVSARSLFSKAALGGCKDVISHARPAARIPRLWSVQNETTIDEMLKIFNQFQASERAR